MPEVTIIMPFYNHHEFIEMALLGFEQQTYKDFEVFIIDDCSTPPFKDDIMKQYSFDWNSWTHDKNKGYAASCNTGISVAKMSDTKYLHFFGADDIPFREMLQKNIDMLQKTERRWIVGGLAYMDLKGIVYEINPMSELNDDTIKNIIYYKGLGAGSITYEKSLFDEIGCYNENLRNSEDREMWQRLILADHYPAYVRKSQYAWRKGSSKTRLPQYTGSHLKWKKIRDAREKAHIHNRA